MVLPPALGYDRPIGPGANCGKGDAIVTTAISRREWMAASAAGVFGAALPGRGARAASQSPRPFDFALNTSTISGQKLTIAEEIAIVAKAGYDGIEPWIRELDAHTRAGGRLEDLGKQAKDLNLKFVDFIGFFEWAVDDDARRKKGLEEARRNFAMVRAVGGSRIAAPPFGATDQADLDLRKVAERYRVLADLGDEFGVTPLVEVWGFSKPISRLGEAAMVAIESGHPRAAILGDVYHLHKGGSGYGGLRLLGRDAMPILHMNDFPGAPREKLADSDRVYPGDGVAPLRDILRALHDGGFRTTLSLELFNRGYWKEDASVVARTGLEKMRASVLAALA